MKPGPLTIDDLRSQTWARLRQALEARQAELLEQLVKDNPPETTAKLRGRIQEIKDLLALSAPAMSEPDPAAAALGLGAFGLDFNT